MSVSLHETTRRYIPKESNLHTRRRENPRFHMYTMLYGAHSMSNHGEKEKSPVLQEN
jgi:hypothetical protein